MLNGEDSSAVVKVRKKVLLPTLLLLEQIKKVFLLLILSHPVLVVVRTLIWMRGP